MKLDPRHVPVEEARREIGDSLDVVEAKHDLTDAEYLTILNEFIATRLRMMVRSERKS